MERLALVKAMKEIESLRKQYENTFDVLKQVTKERDELKHRAEIMWRHLGGDLPASMIWDSFLEDHPEATDWPPF